MSDVILVGLGGIGSRHLQGLAQCPTPLRIRTVDPSPDSRALAARRWAEAGGEQSAHELLDHDLPRYDVAIVATPASVRRQVVEGLAATNTIDAWIVEKPMAQRPADVTAIERIVGARAWVDTIRRLIPWHQAIASEVHAAGGPLDIAVVGGPWGLACNALHFVDLARWWSGSEPVAVDVTGLDREWHASRRPGYAEVFGTLKLSYADGTQLSLTSAEGGGSHQIAVSGAAGSWRIDERAGTCVSADGARIDGTMLTISALTGLVVADLLGGGTPALPPVPPMAAAERLLLDALIPHRHAAGGPADRLDIT